MAPFYAAGLVILYGVNSFATVLASSMLHCCDFRFAKDSMHQPGKRTNMTLPI